jgi:HSP20 family protein
MFQNTRTRLVAPGLPSTAGLEALAFEPWTDLTRQMDRLVSPVARVDGDGAPETAWVPALDVEESTDVVRLVFEVPGVDPATLDVRVHEGVLTVSGERRFAPAEPGQSVYRLERRYGRFSRRVTLPKTIDTDRIAARCEHGVLHLELPKRPEAQPRRIVIRTAGTAADAPPRVETGAPADG